MTDKSNTFVTAPKHVQTTFEKKYLESIGVTQERRIDLPGFSPHLIAKKTELENIQAELAAAREAQERWNVQYELRKTKIDEKKMLFETDQKLQAESQNKIQAEIDKYLEGYKTQLALTRQFDAEFEKLSKDKVELEKEIATYSVKIDELQKAADFFKETVNATNLFESSESILNRYNILKSTKQMCSDNLLKILQSPINSEDTKAELEMLQNKRIGLNNTVSKLRDEIRDLLSQNKYLQSNTLKDIERVNEKECELLRVLTSIDNLTARAVAAQSKLGKMVGVQEKPVTIEQKLDLIVNRFIDLHTIVNSPSDSMSLRKENASSVSSFRIISGRGRW